MKKEMPDLEVLKYHGTKEKPDIKIFVSHRIDMDSQIIDNPLYIPVRCGAVLDERENIDMLGDDTGDNISDKRLEFCELTVQYWAWKNVKADYYGLCHYRRYLSFSDEHFEQCKTEHDVGCVPVQNISKDVIEKHNLQYDKMMSDIPQYDMVCMEPISLKKLKIKSNYEAMKAAPLWHNMKDVDRVIEIIKKKYPEMSEATDYYFFKCQDSWLYNCWIMNRELFEQFSKFQYDVLFELDEEINYEYYSLQKRRACGIIGERLFGLFVTYVNMQQKYKVKYRQLLFVNHPEKKKEISSSFVGEYVPIILLSSDYYVPYVSVLILSIIEHSNCKYNYEITILHKNISKFNQSRLQALVEEYNNIKIRFYNPQYEVSNMKLYVADSRYAEEAYYRMLVPWIMSDCKKAIVMDSDIVVVDDLAKLYYETDVEGYLAAAVKDVVFQGYLNGIVPDTYDYCKDDMKMEDPYNYVNTGVMVVNLPEWRKEYSFEHILDMMRTKKFRIQEQDILNVLLEGKVKNISIGWNFYVEVNNNIHESIWAAPYSGLKAYEQAKKNPHLYHYASAPKPWDDANIPYADKWFYFALKSPFYHEIMARRIDGLFHYLLALIKAKKESYFHRYLGFSKKYGFKNAIIHVFDKTVLKLKTIFNMV